MTPAVVDASVAVRWFVADQPFQDAAFAVRADHACRAPTLLLAEIANALWKYVRADRLSLEAAQEDVALVADEVALVDDRDLMRDAQALSRRFDHPVYDCLYASLAIRDRIPLVTADERLARKLAGAPGLELLELSAYDARRP